MYRRKINLLLFFLYSVCVYSAELLKSDAQHAADKEHIEPDSTISDNKCDCGEHSTGCRYVPWPQKSCECESGYSQKGDICAECSCGDHERFCEFRGSFDYKICHCTDGYVEVNGICTEISSSTDSPPDNLTTRKPECDCGEHSTSCRYHPPWPHQICECESGYSQKVDICAECFCGDHSNFCEFPDRSEYKICNCTYGYVEVNGICTEISSSTDSPPDYLTTNEPECDCGEHSTNCRYTPWPQQLCECESGYSQKGDICAECSCGDHANSCKFHDSFEYKICNCTYGYVEVNGICTEISSSTNSPPDDLTTSGPGCSCGNNSFGCLDIWNTNKLCHCFPFHAQIGERCLECYCGANAFDCRFDTLGNKVCDCRAGYAQKDGKCVECSCGNNSRNCLFDWNGNEICQCSPGYAQRNGTCSETCKGHRDCLPRQKCRKEGNGYFCGCPANYIGEECKVHELCVELEPFCKQMGASCVVDRKPFCRCPPGKTVGLPSGICEDICKPESCSHGKCLYMDQGSYFCECDKGYTGRRCDKEIETDNRHLIIGIIALLGISTAVSIVGNLCFICRKKTQTV